MSVNTIDYWKLAYLLVLLFPVLMINKKLELIISKDLVLSIGRMLVQLTLVGVYLQTLFRLNQPGINLAYIVLMMVVASFSISKNTVVNLKRMMGPIFLSLLIPNLLMILFFNGLVIELESLFEARYLITIGGMLLGNGLSGNIIGLNIFYKGLVKEQKIYQYELSLGTPRFKALLPFIQEAMLGSVKPTIATMATIGLVSLPGMMTGQILGGSLPMTAISYQIAIMVAIFISKYFNLLLVLLFAAHFSFKKTDCLNPDYLKIKIQGED